MSSPSQSAFRILRVSMEPFVSRVHADDTVNPERIDFGIVFCKN